MGQSVGVIGSGSTQHERDRKTETQWKGRNVVMLVAGFGAAGSAIGVVFGGPLGAIVGAIVGIAAGAIYAGYMIYHSDNQSDTVCSSERVDRGKTESTRSSISSSSYFCAEGALNQGVVNDPQAGGPEIPQSCSGKPLGSKSEHADAGIAVNMAEAGGAELPQSSLFSIDFPAKMNFSDPIPSKNPKFQGKSFVDMYFDGSANAIDEVLSQIRSDDGRINGNSNSEEFREALQGAQEPAYTHMLFASSQNIELALRAWLLQQLRYQEVQADRSFYQVSQNGKEKSDFTNIVHDISSKRTEITARFKVQKINADNTVEIVERFEVAVTFDWATAGATIEKRPIPPSNII